MREVGNADLKTVTSPVARIWCEGGTNRGVETETPKASRRLGEKSFGGYPSLANQGVNCSVLSFSNRSGAELGRAPVENETT